MRLCAKLLKILISICFVTFGLSTQSQATINKPESFYCFDQKIADIDRHYTGIKFQLISHYDYASIEVDRVSNEVIEKNWNIVYNDGKVMNLSHATGLYFHSVIYNKAQKRATMVISADGINMPGASVAYCEENRK
mgnify:CR=1 FL=1